MSGRKMAEGLTWGMQGYNGAGKLGQVQRDARLPLQVLGRHWRASNVKEARLGPSPSQWLQKKAIHSRAISQTSLFLRPGGEPLPASQARFSLRPDGFGCTASLKATARTATVWKGNKLI